ncbi:MAG: GntR family transcriptional regulator [Loktanella sp.]|nr:GntR family transcriptional regulator [Loktanella sp.]
MTQRLRLRICLMDPNETHILFENRLAEEFGVSRTPVRQVLQRLAYEHQVETRTGVGTVVPQLAQDRMASEIHLLAGLLDLAAQTATSRIEPRAKHHLTDLEGLIAGRAPAPKGNAVGLFAIHSALIFYAGHLVSEPIVADASAALHWRLLRRLLQQDQQSVDAQRHILDKLCESLVSQQDARAILLLISLAVTDLGKL